MAFTFFLAVLTLLQTTFMSFAQQDAKPSHSAALQLLLEQPKRLLTSFMSWKMLGILLWGLLGWHIMYNTLDPEVLGVFLPLIPFLVLALIWAVIVEILPKVFGLRFAHSIVRWGEFPVRALFFLASPVAIPLRNASRWLQRKIGDEFIQAAGLNQLSEALELSSAEGTTEGEQRILEGIVNFGSKETCQVMTPRIDVFAFSTTATYQEVLEAIREKGYSRIPVYETDLDKVVGVLFVKDLLPYLHQEEADWMALLRAPHFVPETQKLDDLLHDFKGLKHHLAVVVDEYGGTAGIVTLEDVIEEIVGDISDEYDEDELQYSQIGDSTFIFEGKIPLIDFCRLLDLEEDAFEEKRVEAETLAGFLLELFGVLPEKGQEIQFENCLFTIDAVDSKRIQHIKVTIFDD